MAMKLHIGALKTGTTSLQQYCHRHRSFLSERGLYYPPIAPGQRNPDHNWIEATLRRGTEDEKQAIYDLLNSYPQEARNHDHWLLSSESLSLLSKDQITDLRDNLTFQPDEIYLSVRNIYRLIISFLNMRIYEGKQPTATNIDNSVLNNICDFARTTHLWTAVFPDADFKVLVMEKAKPLLEQSYLSQMGIDMDGAPEGQSLNQGIPTYVMWTAVELGYVDSPESKQALRKAVQAAGEPPIGSGGLSTLLSRSFFNKPWKLIDHPLIFQHKEILATKPALPTGRDLAEARQTYLNKVLDIMHDRIVR